MRHLILLAFAFIFMLIVPVTAQPACDPTARITRISVAVDGAQGNADSVISHDISADGNLIVFSSWASNLVPNDTNDESDIFLYNRLTCAISRLSISTTNEQANSSSIDVSISNDGRFVAFTSFADNLIPGTPDHSAQIYVRDLQMDTLTMASVTSDEVPGSSISSMPFLSMDGRYVSFTTWSTLSPDDMDSDYDIYVRDLLLGETILASVNSDGVKANGRTIGGFLSVDGRYVLMDSEGTNMVEDDTNGALDSFVRDLLTGTTMRVSLSVSNEEIPIGTGAGGISSDGRYVVLTDASNAMIPNDNNNVYDVFIHDIATGNKRLISKAMNGGVGDGHSEALIVPSISDNSRFAVFNSLASDLVPDDTNNREDSFLYDLFTQKLYLISRAADGTLGNGASEYPTVSANGYVVFVSQATNLVPGDTNGVADTFVVAVPDLPFWRNTYKTRTPTLAWSGVSWATSYEIEIASDSNFIDVVYSSTVSASEFSVQAEPLYNGLYYWHVRAIRVGGGVGTWSTTESFVVEP